MARACPNGHPIDPDATSRSCPTCGALLVPAEAAAAHVAHVGGAMPDRDPGRVSPKAMAIGLGLLAVAIGLLSGFLLVNPPVPAASPSPSPSGATLVRLA